MNQFTSPLSMMFSPKLPIYSLVLALLLTSAEAQFAPGPRPAWTKAHEQPAMTIEEAKSFMKTLAQYVADHHLKTAESSPQRGMIYEYFWVKHEGQHHQFIQGETLDTMHDGCWFALAMVNGYRATGDPLFRDLLVKWQLPFYLKMLNEGDQLFTSERNDARAGTEAIWPVKERTLMGREKGFVPYWWDDGGSVSMDMYAHEDNLFSRPARDDFAGKPNPKKLMSGYSLGSSNHLAQELGIMLQEAYLLFRESTDPEEQQLVKDITEAIQNLQDTRTRHGAPHIPVVNSAWAVSSQKPEAIEKLEPSSWKSIVAELQKNEYRRIFLEPKPGETVLAPFFADDQAFDYHHNIVADGTLTEPTAFQLAYDAFTRAKPYYHYRGDDPVTPGVGVFDLRRIPFVGGEMKGGRNMRLIGSRFGIQNAYIGALALQAWKKYPDLWENGRKNVEMTNLFPPESAEEVKAYLERELTGGLRTWEAIFNEYGYIPAGIDAGGKSAAGFEWEELSHCAGYAYLIIAASQWIFLEEGKSDWELQNLPDLSITP